MPYEINEVDSEFWVQNSNTGRRMHKRPYRTKKEALRYLGALEANVSKSVKHGGFHSAAEKDKLQAIHDHAAAMGADCGGMDEAQAKGIKAAKYMLDQGMDEEGGEAYARQELSDISVAASALSSLTMLYSEMDEPDDAREVAALMRGIINFISGEIDEMEQAATGETGEKHVKETTPAQVKTEDKKSLNLDYVKALGIEIPDLAVKFVGRDAIKGYTFLWGHPEKRDMSMEYFSPETDFWDKTLGKSVRPLTWDHAQDDELKADPRIGEIVDFGDDEVGRWYEAHLDRAHRYRKAVDQMIKEGLLGTSSDSAPQYVVRERTGKSTWLKQWPWFASALTDVPCEPRMIGSIEILKSWGVALPDESLEVARQVEALGLRERELKLRSHMGGF